MSRSGVSVGSSCWEVCATAILWDRVAPKHSSGLCGGFAAGWEEMAVTLWGGGVMVSRTSPWSQPFVRTGGEGSMSVRETHNKLIPTCSWNASLIQLLRDPNASIVTCRTFTNRIWRLFTMKSLLWRKDRPNRQTSVGLDGREVLAQPSQ